MKNVGNVFLRHSVETLVMRPHYAAVSTLAF